MNPGIESRFTVGRSDEATMDRTTFAPTQQNNDNDNDNSHRSIDYSLENNYISMEKLAEDSSQASLKRTDDHEEGSNCCDNGFAPATIKRQRGSEDALAPHKELETEEALAQQKEKWLSYHQRWMEHDRSPAFQLLWGGGAAMYDWGQARAGMVKVAPNQLWDVSGAYDIVFCHGERTTGSDESNKDCISRSFTEEQRGQIKFNWSTPLDGNEPELEFSYAFIGETSIAYAAWNDDREEFHYHWEEDFQVSSVGFLQQRQDETRRMEGYIIRCAGEPITRDFLVDIKILKNSGTLDWAPNERGCKQERENHDDTGYYEYMRDSLRNRHSPTFWTEEASWLCHHKGIPACAARIIHEYNMPDESPPPPQWQWKEGDLFVELNRLLQPNSTYRHQTTTYIARKRVVEQEAG